MPLLHKKPFVKKKLPKHLQPSDKVFFCELTQEVFLEYDEFWERLVLLNALVWSCELTGRPNLTYQEALESEAKAQKSISNISEALKKPLLYILTYTKRGRINDVSDDVFNYIRDRYFVEEEVEAIVSKHWYDCKVTKVIMPTEQEIADYKKSIESSDDEDEVSDSHPPLMNGIHNPDNKNEDDIFVLRDDHHNISNNDPLKISKAEKIVDEEDEEHPPFATVKYEVLEIEPWDYKERKYHIVTWDQIKRPKSDFTRDKCKMFVKQSMKMEQQGYWVLKESLERSCNINNMKYSDIFVGKPPKFHETPLKKSIFTSMMEKKKPNNNNNNKVDKPGHEKKDGERKKKEIEQKKKEIEAKKKEMEAKKKEMEAKKEFELKKQPLTEKEKEDARKAELEMKERAKRDFQERLEKMRLERKWKKDLQKEECRLMKIYEMEWLQKREDLECEDNKNIPETEPLKTRLPMDHFGDFLMILDFVNTFTETLELNDVYPNGITYEMLENALVVNEVAGVFNDVIQLLLGAIFSLQEEEDEECDADPTQDNASMNFQADLEIKCQMAAVKIANQASTWSQQYQGVALQKAPLDALTLTEILRIHILASGATNVANAFWRHMNRGGFKHTDDPGLQFKLEEPEIIKKLSSVSIFDLNVEEKIKVLHILVCQILTYASVRDAIEEKLDKLREVSLNFRNYKWAAVRKEREEIQARKQKMKDLKLEVEKRLMEQRLQLANGEGSTAQLSPAVVEMEVLEENLEGVPKEKETRASSKKKEKEGPQEKDFIEQIENLCKDVKQFSLGQDRAFRRYWLFNSIPGLFVEDKITELGLCCEFPTPVFPLVSPKEDMDVKKAIKEQALKNIKILHKEKELEKSSSSDKENENESLSKVKNSGSALSENNLLRTPNSEVLPSNINKSPVNSTDSSFIEEEIVDLVTLPKKPPQNIENLHELHSRIFGLCSGDSNSCPAHSGINSRPRWSYYCRSEQLEDLISSLNGRGIRESELKNNLTQNKEKILASFEAFTSFQFDFSNKEDNQNDLKKALKRNLNFPPGTPTDRILELTLRDMILETEEKIDNGMLGRLKVPERDAWRQAVVDGNFSALCNPQEIDYGGKKRIQSSLGLETTDDALGDMEEFMTKEGMPQMEMLKELAVAILLLGQAVDSKFLKSPLAETEKQSRRRTKIEERIRNKSKKLKKEADGDDNSSSDEEVEKIAVDASQNTSNNALRTPFERWEKSLMGCSSFSQLFLHLATLDNSITWTRSATLKRRCRICRRSSDYESMLLCDECDGGFHMFCLKPKLTSVPEGDWYCDKCKPKNKPKSPRKQRSVYKEVSDEESDDEGELKESDDEGEEEDEEKDEGDLVNQEYCAACEMGGELVCCDTCPKSFHLDCADLRKIPRGHWSCPLCKEKEIASAKKKSSPKSGSSRKKLKTDEEIEATLHRSSSSKGSTRYDVDDDYTPDTSSRRSASKRDTSTADLSEGELHRDTIEKLIHCLMSHNDSVPFRKPVYRQEVPDYYVKIKKPMDLRTIKRRFNSNKYLSDAEFIADVLLIFQNTQQFYKEDNQHYKAGTKLSKYFINKVKNSDLHTGGQIESNNPPSKRRKRS